VADAKVEKSGVNSSELIKNPNEDTSLASTSTTKNNAIVKQDALRKSNATKLPNLIKEANKPSVNNSIVENEPSKQATDEVKINLEDALAENNTEAASEKDEKSTDKWQINTMLAPVYYNSIGEGSPIDAQFKDNAKQGDINLSYGLNIAYRLSNKISLRSGVNKVNLGYETQDISYQASFEGGDLATVNYTSTAANITVSDKPALSANTANSSNDELFVSASTARNGLGTAGTMNQQLAYIEVPLELTFKLVDSKLGVNLIGGMSTLFLTDNSITLESANLITDMGEANNINDLSFSTNIGLGFDYKVSSHLHFNLEPMFKYQLNAFSSDSGNFKPYYLGVYTGFSYKF
jgi:PPE-repeat protein